MNGLIQNLITGIILLLLSSCAAFWPTGYNSLTQNVPLLKSQYECQTMFTFGINHIEEQVSFSPLNHIGLIGNFFQHEAREKGSTFEAGIGYYKLFKDSFQIEAYSIYTNSYNQAAFSQDVGISISGTHPNDAMLVHDFLANYNGTSLQIDLGQHFKKIKLALCLRYSLMNYNAFYYHRTNYDNGIYSTPTADTIYYLPSRYQSFITIAPTFEIGGRVRYYAQVSYHLNLNNASKSIDISQTPPFYSGITFTNGIKLYFDFGKRKKQQ